MGKLKKLTIDDVSLVRMKRAVEQGDQPSVLFHVKNAESVKKFLAESDAIGRIWTEGPKDARGRDALRLSYTYDEAAEELKVSRVVMPTTFPQPANATLAQAVLTCIVDAHESFIADIYSGLTRRDSLEYEPSGAAKSIFDEFYGEDHPEDTPAP